MYHLLSHTKKPLYHCCKQSIGFFDISCEVNYSLEDSLNNFLLDVSEKIFIKA